MQDTQIAPLEPTPAEADGADRYGSVLEQLIEGFQVIDRRYRYLYVNDTVVSHARLSRHALLGRSMLDLYPGIEQTPMFRTLERCMRQRTSARMENHFTYPDGQDAWFELRFRPVPEGLVVLSIDITARKALEARVQQSERLDAAGRMAAGLAHDFGNLLTAIQGSISLALRRTSTDAIQRDLELARGAADRAEALVAQLMAFCRRREVEPRPLALVERIEGFSALLATAVGSCYPLSLSLEPTPAVLIDPGAFEQVLLNLVVNAADATPGGGPITIRTGDVIFERETHFGPVSLPPGRYASLTVTDVGTGMAPDVAARIFEPFFTTKGESEGTGLGLSSCYGIVCQAAGAIAVCSEPGQGSSFSVYLPAAH